MGYTTEFTGSVTIDPPLNATEISYLHTFAETRHDDRRAGEPGIWCDWVSTDDGTAIVWSGAEKFYRSSDWMRYLIDTFLGPRKRGKKRRTPVGFTHDHVLNGSITATGQDGAMWTIDVTDNSVVTNEVRGPLPPTYSLYVIARGTYPELDREFDSIHGRASSRVSADSFLDTLARLLEAEPQLTLVADGMCVARNDEYGMTIEVDDDAVGIHLDLTTALNTGEQAFAAALGIAERFAWKLGWIAFDPAQRCAIRLGKEYRSRAIELARGWMRGPDSRFLWSVV